jgi:hypothetical protein
MISETTLADSHEYRSAVVSLKPKRRFKCSRSVRPEEKPKLAIQNSPFVERKEHERFRKSGRPNPILRRVMAPSQFSEALPQLPKSSLGRRVVDFIKHWQFGTHAVGRGFLPRPRAVQVSR